MTSPLHVAVLVGSLRASSLNRRLFLHARSVAPEGVVLEEASISDLPLYSDDLRGDDGNSYPAPVDRLRRQLQAADAVLFVSPEYNYSIPAPLKNAIDWASRGSDQPFAGKAVAIMGASPGMLGTARMQYHLRQVLVFLDAHPLNKPEVMVMRATSQLGDDAEVDDRTTDIIRQQLSALADWARVLRG